MLQTVHIISGLGSDASRRHCHRQISDLTNGIQVAGIGIVGLSA
jgi:hypothetical protein